ncbi:DNA topology modulation protein [Paenibacillus sp. FA6]|uniref:DNA topology modulation protein n=1 Tax=Paenibacillus sp. FA6 TaxID=3413029 RepID=UPI003F658146
MERVMIIGSGGSGKSTLARKLSNITRLPLYHLDAYYWQPGWIATPNEEWDTFQQELILNNEWIIDGNYSRTLDIRIARADTIIFFDLSPWITTFRVIKRRIKYHGRTRPDLNEGCPEQLDWEFIRWVWNFRKHKRPAILDKLKIHEKDKNIIILRSFREVKSLLDQFRNRTT